MDNKTENSKRIAKNTLLLYSRMLLLMAVSLFSSRILLQSLGSVDYGLNNVIGGVIAMFSYLNNTLSTSTSRFLTFELGRNDIKKTGDIFNNAFWIHFSYAIIFSLIAETVGLWFVNNVLNIPPDRLFACNIVYQVVIFSAALKITLVPRNALIIAYERMNVYAYLGIFDALVKLSIAFAIQYSSFDKLILLSLLQLIADVLLYAFYWYYTNKHFEKVCKLLLHVSKDTIRKLLGFTTWSLFGSTSLMARNQGMTMLINIFFGATVNAANAVASQVNFAITQFTTNFTVAINPQIIKSYAAKEYDEMKSLFFRGGKFSFFLLLLLVYPVLFETDFILKIWLGNYPKFTTDFTRWVLVLSMVEVFNSSIAVAVQATGKIKWYQIIISIIQILAFPFGYILFKLGMPPYSALMSMVVLGIVAVLIRLYFIWHLLGISPIEYLNQVLLRCMIIAVIALIVPIIITNIMDESVLRFVVVILCGSIWSIGVIFILGMTKGEKQFIFNGASKIINVRKYNNR